MFNIFGAIGSMLPGYVEGQRSAIKDNWYDLNQYSDVQAKQLQNLYTEATFNPLVNMQYNEAARSYFLAQQDARENALGMTLQPYRLRAAKVQGQFMPIQAGLLGYEQTLYGLGGGGYYGGDTLDGAMGYPQPGRVNLARGGGINRPTLANGR